MPTPITVPVLGESVTEATVAKWLKKVGDAVKADEPLVELETDKVTVEVNAAAAGTLTEITVQEGANVPVGAVLGQLGAAGTASAATPAPKTAPTPVTTSPTPSAAPNASASPAGAYGNGATSQVPTPAQSAGNVASAHAAATTSATTNLIMPSAQRLATESGVNTAGMNGTGKDGRILKEDIMGALNNSAAAPAAKAPAVPRGPGANADREERVKMTRLRQRIAERLKEAQNTAAMLTTFNEVDMSAIMALRAQYKDGFEKRHGVKMGFMSFFVKAAVAALKELPAVNAEIDGDEIVYKNYYDIGVAVGTPSGLVVPVVRDCDTRDFAGIEKEIGALALKARDGKLSMAEMSGGTFTITNGGVYGSLMSTPILNTPQSGILGMHKTIERPVAVNGKVEIRPMMYVALSYDHRIIDGREAVTFLVKLKEAIEDPSRLLLGV